MTASADLSLERATSVATVTRGSPAVRLERISSFGEAHAIASEWDALITSLHGSLYMTFSWCQVWWRHYGSGRELRLFAARAGDELVGVLPFFIDRLRLPFRRVRVAKLLGSDSTISLVEPAVITDVAAEALTLAMRRLFVDDHVDMVHIGPCPEASPQLDAVRRAAAAIKGVARMVRDRASGAHTVFEIPDGFDAYLRSLSKNQRSNYRRNLNKLGNTFRFEVDVVRDATVLEGEFERFIDMHQAQWKKVNNLGHFDDWPRSRDFSRDLVRALSQTDHVRLIRLLADEKVVAYYWCFVMNGTYYWRLPARLSGDQWDQFGLGRVGLMKMIEVAAAEGNTTIEAGAGRYEYKEKLNAKTFPLHSIVLRRRGFAPLLHTWLTLASGEILNLAYYRFWYIRVAPRMGILRQPLRRSWIRRRF